jgi:hypothetical protein
MMYAIDVATRLGLKRCSRSWPDVSVPHEALHGIELNQSRGRLSQTRTVCTRRKLLRIVEGQRDAVPRLQAAATKLRTCDSVGAVLAAFAAWGVPLRWHT